MELFAFIWNLSITCSPSTGLSSFLPAADHSHFIGNVEREVSASFRPPMLKQPRVGLVSMSLNAVVKGRDGEDRQWKETADVVSVSATGSSFNLGRRCEVGT